MKNIILDTDLGGDCDDASAIALVNKFYNDGKINVLGMTYSNSHLAGACLTRAINAYYGNDFRTGMLENDVLNIPYIKDFSTEALKILGVSLTKKGIENANDTIYDLLTKSKDKSVTFVCIGQLKNVGDFLNYDFNGTSGADIFNAKVETLYIMGGWFNQPGEYYMSGDEKLYGEYNLITDLGSAKTVMNKVDTEIVFCDFDAGVGVLTFGKFSSDYNPRNPVSVSYKLFENGPRHSWDPLTVLYAVVGDNEYFGSERGRVTLTDKGRTLFEKDEKANARKMYLKKSKEETAEYLESFFADEL